MKRKSRSKLNRPLPVRGRVHHGFDETSYYQERLRIEHTQRCGGGRRIIKKKLENT